MSGPPLPWRPLRRALLRPPAVEVDTPEEIARWGYQRARDLAAAREQHRAFADHLRAEGADVVIHDAPVPGCADACYACDPALMTRDGAIILRMGKPQRAAENAAMASALSLAGVPVRGRIDAPGVVEGGDCIWIDETTLCVGEGYRTNAQGISQLAALLPEARVVDIQLPHFNGPAECMHLQSLFSFVDVDKAVIHLPITPVRLVTALEARGIGFLPLPVEEFDSLGSNILCTAPGRVVIAAGNPRTVALMRSAGVRVTEMDADDLMWVGTGGPTCLTLPLLRAGDTASDSTAP